MKKVILVDGNNLMFRSFYATMYSGSIMKNSKGLPTNALYGFTNMINKIVEEEKPEYMCVAFDVGKNFRKQEYSFYKEGRQSTPEELKIQMPIARRILDAMGISHVELEPYEADDIIGTIVSMAERDPEYASTIISSDKDLLQLISDETEVKLLKQTGYIRYNKETFINDYQIEPKRIIDLKALMGDASDNIPGVKGIGEKGALKLLQEFESLENVYEHIDDIKGKTQEKLVNDQENAFMSKKIATIYREVPLNVSFEEFKYLGNTKELRNLFEELEFHSLLKNMKIDTPKCEVEFKVIESVDELKLDNLVSFYLECDEENYHRGKIIGASLTDKNHSYFIKPELINDVVKLLKDKKVITYDLKKCLVKLGSINSIYDLMIAGYLLNYNVKDDIANLMTIFNEEIIFYHEFKKKGFPDLENTIVRKSKFIFDTYEQITNELKVKEQMNLFANIEMPLIYVLADMEINGFKVRLDVLNKMKEEVLGKIDVISREIFRLSGCVFNISSPKQLGEVLFEKLEIDKGKKNKTGYKTDVKTLHKLVNRHPVVEKVLEYRALAKLYSTYLEGLESYVFPDGKIHTIFNQTLTRTGRLSSMEPNLQNIPIKEELGRRIRLAFVPQNDFILSADYSQIELRVLAHISDSKELQSAFIHDEDIHRKVAADIYGVPLDNVTSKMRSTAKAVIFGIVYGISGFGLGENLNITRKEAQDFINKYYEFYPGVKKYMDEIILETKQTGYVKTLFGRIRVIDEIKNANFLVRQMGERMALNTPIQGTSADIMKLAMIEVFNKFKELNLKSKMILQVHDEIIVDVSEDEKDLVKRIVKETMENIYELKVPLKVEVSFGENWYEAK